MYFLPLGTPTSLLFSTFPFFPYSPLQFTQTKLHRWLLSGLPNRQSPLSFSLYFYPTAARIVI